MALGAVALAVHLSACSSGASKVRSFAEAQSPASALIVGRVVEAPSETAESPVGMPGQSVFAVALSTGDTVATTTSEADGIFRLSVPPGAYTVHAPYTRRYVDVKPGETASVILTVPAKLRQ